MELKYTVLTIIALMAGANATELAINFNTGAGYMTSGSAFGVPAANWNNLNGNSGKKVRTRATDGREILMSWDSYIQWAMDTTLPSAEGAIYKGYLDDGLDGANHGVVISVAMKGVYKGTYSVTIFQGSDMRGGMNWQPLTVNGTMSKPVQTSKGTNRTTFTGLSGDLHVAGGARIGSNRGSISGLLIKYESDPDYKLESGIIYESGITYKSEVKPELEIKHEPKLIKPSRTLISVGGIELGLE